MRGAPAQLALVSGQAPWPAVAALALTSTYFVARAIGAALRPERVVIDPAAPTIRFLEPGAGRWFGPRLEREVVRSDVLGLRLLTFREPARSLPTRSVDGRDQGSVRWTRQPGIDLTHDLRAAKGLSERAALVLHVKGRRFPIVVWNRPVKEVDELRALAARAGELLGHTPVEVDWLHAPPPPSLLERSSLTAEQQLENLAAAALADGALAPAEEAMLARHADRLGFSPEQARAFVARAQGGAVKLHLPRSEDDRLATFEAIVEVVRADLRLTDRERRMIEVLADRLEVPAPVRARALATS